MHQPASSSQPLTPGTVLQGYRVESTLGRGGMGTVYRAVQVSGGRAVALKLLHGRPGPDQLERFRREGAVTAALQHPGIVPVHDAGEVGGRPFIVYGLVEGARHLDDLYRERDLDARVRLVLEAAQALAYAHAQQVVHRDVKPENLLVDAEGRVRVADFGLARVDDGQQLTRTGAVLGTPLFMAPEQLDGADVGPAADVWALGVVLFQALTLSLPFQATSLLELRAQIASGGRSPRSLDASVPRPLDAVCQRALAVHPEERYADAGQLAEDLARALRGERVASPGRAVSERLKRSSRPLRWLLPLVPAAGLLAYASLATPALPAPETPAPARRQEVAEPGTRRGVGWDLRHGERCRIEFGWKLERAHDDPNLPGEHYEVALRGVGEVREVTPSFVNLEIRIEWMRLRADQVVSSTEAPHFLLPLGNVLGQSFFLHLEQPGGRVRRVLGVRALRERVAAGTMDEARAALDQALGAFSDRTLQRNLNVVSLAPTEDDARARGWSQDVEVWVTGKCGLRHTPRITPQGEGRFGYATQGAEPLPDALGQVREVSLEGSCELRDGRVVSADAKHGAHVTTSKESFKQALVVWLRTSPVED